MHPVFDIIPRENFKALSAPKASVFLELLLRLWQASDAATGMISQDTVNRVALDVATDPSAVAALQSSEDGRVKGEGEISPEQFAAEAVQQLINWNWLTAENDVTFGTEYLFSPGGSILLEFLQRVSEGAHDDVVTAVLRIHDGLYQAVAQDDDRHHRIFEAQRTADHFVNELNTLRLQMTALNNKLNSEMQRHEIFDVLLGEVHNRSIDLLHELNSTHHVSRYRPAINQYVERLLEPAMLRRAAANAHNANPSTTIDEHQAHLEAALVHIQKRLDYAKNELLDPLLATEARLSHRADALYRAAQIDTHTVRQRLLRITQLALGHGIPVPEGFFRFDIVALPPQNSLPNLVRMPHVFQPAKVKAPKLTPAEFRAAEQEALESATNRFGPEALNAWLEQQMAGRTHLRASELSDLPIRGVHLITNLWEWRSLLRFTLQPITDAKRVTVDNARFDDFIIAPKERPSDQEAAA